MLQGPNRKTVGRTSSYSQQLTLLKKRGEKKSPQEMVLVDLAKEVKKRLDEGCEILICIDANEQMNDKKSRIQEFEVDLGLIDIAAERDDNPPQHTRQKNSKTHRYVFWEQ